MIYYRTLLALSLTCIFTGCAISDYVQPYEDWALSTMHTRESAQIAHVIDGDTVVLDSGEKVRLLGIDTPERGKYYYQEATEALRTLLSQGDVSLVRDVSETDRYGRLLRHLYVGDLWVNAEMVRSGFARMVTFPPDVSHVEYFQSLQREAQKEQYGLWQLRE